LIPWVNAVKFRILPYDSTCRCCYPPVDGMSEERSIFSIQKHGVTIKERTNPATPRRALCRVNQHRLPSAHHHMDFLFHLPELSANHQLPFPALNAPKSHKWLRNRFRRFRAKQPPIHDPNLSHANCHLLHSGTPSVFFRLLTISS
jgi:hypothetical protein